MTGPRKPDSGGKLKLSNTKPDKLASAKSELSKIRSHSGKPAPKRKSGSVDDAQGEPSSTRPSGEERSSGAPSRSGQGRPTRRNESRPERSGSDGQSNPNRNRSEQGKAGRDRPKRPADPSRSDISRSGNSKSGKPAPSFAPDAHEARPRLFYALHLPTPVANALAAAQKELRGNWRAVQPDQLHITLAYLPSTDPARLSDFKALGETLSLETPPLTVKLRGTGYHPNEGSPRVWFVRVESEGLDALAERLRSGIAELGAETDTEPFKAHITLARKKGPAPRVPPITFDTAWEAPTLTLYRSHLQKTGPVYENLASFKFRGTIMSSAESAPAISANQDQASRDQPDTIQIGPSPEDTL